MSLAYAGQFEYIKQAIAERQEHGLAMSAHVLDQAIRHGAVLRVRPKSMTVAVILAGRHPSWRAAAPARRS